MLKDVRIHLHADESRQQALEQQLATLIMNNYRRNQATFKAFVPSLYNAVKNAKSQDISVFANKDGELNIVNFSNGRTFYGTQPSEEIYQQYRQRLIHCTYCKLSKDEQPESSQFQQVQTLPLSDVISAQPGLPQAPEVVVVLGIGIAEHIRFLLENHQIQHLIIYEPEMQYFQCSVLAQDWRPLFELSKKRNTKLYFQLENAGTTLFDDINELTQHNDIKGFYLYRHYNTTFFNVLEHALLTDTWSDLNKNGLSRYMAISRENALPLWSPVVNCLGYSRVSKRDSQFHANIEAFRLYFPAIADEFVDYTPDYWLTAKDSQGHVNIFSELSNTPWFSENMQQDAALNFENFCRHPNKDGLVLGYTGKKLKHYLHFQFVDKAQKLLDSTTEEATELPHTVRSLILFGIGPQLSLLSEQHEIEKLFICEPDRDLFYASMFYLDWASILQKVDEKSGRLYINVGDDGSNLFKDLINQFYSVGPYILANTYFYQTYYNETLVHTISQLREQLQVVIAMGENFDHARYGIAHTHEAIRRQYPLLKSHPAQKMSFVDKEVPVFVVGNGPSLDSAIGAIEEWQDQAIIISCGTALMPLYKNGIVPDFHAEIEQNRSTFDWCSRIGDFEYLKKINLLSCNGLHPDTCDLFKNTFLAFKEGESATVSSLNILGRENYEELQFAFPTVSNFVMNVVTLLGFEQIYLFGVDLGFADKKNHHSRQSGYFDDNGHQKYDYEKTNNTNLVVPGNFQRCVFTKYEFKVSKMIIGRSLARTGADCFNTSDGARIEGTKPLTIDNILLTSSSEQKQKTLKHLEHVIFEPVADGKAYQQKFMAKYSEDNLENEFNKFLSLASKPISCKEDVVQLTDKQKELLLISYSHGRSLLFYYLYGTVNYANSMFSKLCYAALENDELLMLLNEMRELWLNTLHIICEAMKLGPGIFDYVSSFTDEREQVYLRKRIPSLKIESLLTPFESEKLDYFMERISGQWKHKVSGEELVDSTHIVARYPFNSATLKRLQCSNKPKIILVEHGVHYAEVHQACGSQDVTIVYQHETIETDCQRKAFLEGKRIYAMDVTNMVWLIKTCLSHQHAAVIMPKVYITERDGEMSAEVAAFCKFYISILGHALRRYRFANYWLIPKYNTGIVASSLDGVGNRGEIFLTEPENESLILEVLSRDKATSHLATYIRGWWKKMYSVKRPY